MFASNMKESLIEENIIIRDVLSHDFNVFINYCYAQVPEIKASNVGALLYLAHKYMIEGLVNYINEWLKINLSVNNIINVISNWLQYNQKQKIILKWMNNCKDKSALLLFKDDSFNTLDIKIIKLLFKGFGFSSLIHCTKLWKACLSWCNNNGNQENQQNTVNNLKLLINDFPFYRLHPEVIVSEVLPLNVLSQNQLLEILSHNCNNTSNMSIIKKLISNTNKKNEYPMAKDPKQRTIPMLCLRNTRASTVKIVDNTGGLELSGCYSETTSGMLCNFGIFEEIARSIKWNICLDTSCDASFGIANINHSAGDKSGSTKHSWGFEVSNNFISSRHNGETMSSIELKPLPFYNYGCNFFDLELDLVEFVLSVKCENETLSMKCNFNDVVYPHVTVNKGGSIVVNKVTIVQ